jgi:hypothetical protein
MVDVMVTLYLPSHSAKLITRLMRIQRCVYVCIRMYTTLSLLDYAISIIHTRHIYALPIALADNEVSLQFFRITRQCYNERINKA